MQDILKNRNRYIFGLIIIFSLLLSCGKGIQPKSNVLLITGGHSFDTVEFFKLFESFADYKIDTLSQPFANQFIADGKALEYDVLVFYDYWQAITETGKKAYLELTDKGIGLLFLHHSLVSYQGWEEFSKICGGRYPKSDPPDSIHDGRYRHDIDLMINIVDTLNPVTRGMKDFIIHDEGYSNVLVNESVTPILKTIHPDCSEMFGWTHQYNNSKVVYLMGGHDKQAYENFNYKELIKNSLDYLSGSK